MSHLILVKINFFFVFLHVNSVNVEGHLYHTWLTLEVKMCEQFGY